VFPKLLQAGAQWLSGGFLQPSTNNVKNLVYIQSEENQNVLTDTVLSYQAKSYLLNDVNASLSPSFVLSNPPDRYTSATGRCATAYNDTLLWKPIVNNSQLTKRNASRCQTCCQSLVFAWEVFAS